LTGHAAATWFTKHRLLDLGTVREMKIERIELSVFETPANTGRFDLAQVDAAPGHKRWVRRSRPTPPGQIHVLHVWTDDGIEGMCTVGDARYSTMRTDDLEMMRLLAIGQDPLQRDLLFDKMSAATRGMFTLVGWHGTFDNCLWDIAGKAAGLPVHKLIGSHRDCCQAYYNFGGPSPSAAAEDAIQARDRGFALKDHFHDTGSQNEIWFRTVRDAVGPEPVLLHDAASCDYNFEEALRVGQVLQELDFGWFEEPISDRDQVGLQRLCTELDIPILAPETMMNDLELSQLWLTSGAVDMLRVNARHGMTMVLRLAALAQERGTTVEANGPGGLFGLVHAHLVCAVHNTSYYEYFPGGSRDEVGAEIGLLNPPVPQDGHIAPPDLPGWGAQWDREFFERIRVAVR
jgi:L-alanine-DL-glutamate epimerase-like enolase superfamily enzyme